ncbi:protein Skeletor, isoforms D/E-like [Armigeres subalbatus]
MIISHYQKPVSPLMRPFMPKSKLPVKAIAPILLLGEPTEIKPFRKAPPPPPLSQLQSMAPQPIEMMLVKPMKTVPYMVPDVSPHLTMGLKKIEPAPITLPIRLTKRPIMKEPPQNVKPIFKAPYDVHENKTPIDPQSSTGFEPSSVVVESGFKPIYRRNGMMNAEYDDLLRHHGDMIQRRQDYDIDEAIESDALMIGSGEPQRQAFEPMFIPSPLDSMALAQKSAEVEERKAAMERLTGDLKEMNVEEGEDKMAMPDDRVDSYYLPPATQNVVKVYPEGSVVSYDGKAVLDVSLLNSPSNVRQEAIKSVSKTEQFIRDNPQFGPFRGEIPPISDYVAPDSHPIYGVRGPNSVQSPVSEYANPLVPGGINAHDNKDLSVKPISTKLSIIKPVEEQPEESRKKREAHHHPDHHGDSHDDGWEEQRKGVSSASTAVMATLFSVFAPLVLFRRAA